MNTLQVAKVTYEADRALAATHGEPDAPPFEALTQHDKDQIVHRIDAALTGRARGRTATLVAREAAGPYARQRVHLFTSIVHALAQHEDDIRNPNRPLPTPIPISTMALSGPPAADSGQAPAAALAPPQSPPQQLAAPTGDEDVDDDIDDHDFDDEEQLQEQAAEERPETGDTGEKPPA